MPTAVATESVRRKYNRNARWFDSMDRIVEDDWRKAQLAHAAGHVLEIGVGTGKNLPFYSPTVTERLQATDLSPGMLECARLKPCAVPLTPHEMDAQRMTFPDATFDPSVAAW